MKSYRDELIKDLAFRIERIDYLASKLPQENKERDYKDFYQEISHFIHFILKNDNLKLFYLELLNITYYIPIVFCINETQ